MTAQPTLPKVLVTGGAGYVGAVLVPRLLRAGYAVRVLDLYVYGDDALAEVRSHPRLEECRGDLRHDAFVRQCLRDVDAVIHLACISNDPSCELDPELSRSINYDAFEPLVRLSVEAGARRFIFASSSSLYGVSDAPQVTEEHPRHPLTLYNTFKGMCEDVLFRYQSPAFTTVSVRPATICGRSPRQRLDLTVNILTAHAVERGIITVFGGEQQRPNLHMEDIVRLYQDLLEVPDADIAGEAFNVGYQNATVAEIARTVRDVVARELPGRDAVRIETTPSNDPRSYHICSDKIRTRLGFVPRHTIEDAVHDLTTALRRGELPAALTDPIYYNVQRMRAVDLR